MCNKGINGQVSIDSLERHSINNLVCTSPHLSWHLGRESTDFRRHASVNGYISVGWHSTSCLSKCWSIKCWLRCWSSGSLVLIGITLENLLMEISLESWSSVNQRYRLTLNQCRLYTHDLITSPLNNLQLVQRVMPGVIICTCKCQIHVFVSFFKFHWL